MSRLFNQLLPEKVIDQDIENHLEKSRVELKLVSSQDAPIELPEQPKNDSSRLSKLGKPFVITVLAIFLSIQWYLIQQMKISPVVSKSVPAALADEQNDSDLNIKAIQLLKNGSYEDAHDQFKALLRRHPSSSEILNNLGMSLVKLKKQKLAKAYFRDAIKNSPILTGSVVASAYNNLGSIYLEKKHFDQAIFNFQKAILINHALIEARLNLGKAFELSGKIEDAILTYESYIASPSSDAALNETLKQRITKLKYLSHTTETVETSVVR